MIGTTAAGAGALATGSLLTTLTNLADKGFSAMELSRNFKQGSLTSFTAAARVEPITVVDASCLHLEYLPEVLQSLQSIFTGYYLQAVSLIADVGNVKVIKMLDKLNPNRQLDVEAFLKDMAGAAVAVASEEICEASNWKLSMESYKWRLPTESNVPAMEEEVKKASVTTMNATEKSVLSVTDFTNLSVGKLVNVEFKSNGQSITVPVAVRLLVSSLPSSSIINLLDNNAKNNGLIERVYKWRAGRIDFVKDLILCQDLIAEHKKNLLADREGVMREILNRAKNNKLSAYSSKQPSLAAASNLFVISEEVADTIKRESGLNIDDFRDRQKIFESTYGMIIVVIDREFQRVNFYHRDIRMPTSVGVRDIKMSAKGTGPDITDILNAYKKGEQPTL
jgi:hypothetical protein